MKPTKLFTELFESEKAGGILLICSTYHLHSHLPLLPLTNPRKQSQKKVQATALPTTDNISDRTVIAHRKERAAAANMGLTVA